MTASQAQCIRSVVDFENILYHYDCRITGEIKNMGKQIYFKLSGITIAITMTSKWARWRLKSPASRVFTQPFIQAQIKENIKAPRHWPLCGEFTGDWWIPHTTGQ